MLIYSAGQGLIDSEDLYQPAYPCCLISDQSFYCLLKDSFLDHICEHKNSRSDNGYHGSG